MGKRGCKPEKSQLLPVRQLRPQRTGKTLVKKRALRRIGLNFRMGLHAFIASLFKTNESLPQNLKMTDYEIVRQIRKEFAENQKIIDRIDYKNPKIQSLINTYRMNYNLGLVTSEGPPKYEDVSFPYDDRGLPVSSRATVAKVLTPEFLHERRSHYATKRNEWLEARGQTKDAFPHDRENK